MTGRPDFPRLAPADLDDDQRALYAALTGGRRAGSASVVPLTDADGRLEGPFNALLYAPATGLPLQALGEQIRYGMSLSDRERELVTLLVAGKLRSGYELFAHRRLAARAGVAVTEIEALAAGLVPPDLADRERTLLDLTDQLVDGRVEDATLTAGVALGRRVVVEVTVLVGYYRTLALLLDTCDG